jgi:hypothetical protein
MHLAKEGHEKRRFALWTSDEYQEMRAGDLTDPVGPTTRLTQPGLKKSSPSTLRRNLRLEGVTVPSFSSIDHEKVVSRKPMTSESGWLGPTISGVSGSFEMNESRSSV